MALDIDKLENVQQLGGGRLRSGCPACLANGADPQRIHLFVYQNGSYGCAANKKDATHTREIFKLVGIKDGVPTVSDSEPTFKRPELDIEICFNEKDLDRLLFITDYWNGRGISDKTLEVFKGGLSSNNKMNHRFCFPIYNEYGKIHGMTGRWTLPVPTDLPWKHLGKTSNWLYPLYFNLQYIKESGCVFIVESVGDMLALWEAGIKNVLVLFGSTMSPALLAKLVGLNLKKVYICTNNDIKHTVGQRAAALIKKSLEKFYDADVPEIRLPPEKDFGLMTKENIIKWRNEIC